MVYDNGVVANEGVNFSVKKGEIHALVGENGAGKSTLMKIAFGLEKPTKGRIFFDDKEVKFSSPNDAIESGIGMVHQHFKLVSSLTVAENLVLGKEPASKGIFNYEKAIEITEKMSERFNFELEATDIVEEISVSKKQKLEILKAIYRDAKLIIMDEPTAVLTPQETEELFEQLKEMRDQGITIIFISHKLEEIKALCDRLTILRNGKSMGTHIVSDISEEDISRLMVGRDIVLDIDKPEIRKGNVCLSVRNLSYRDYFGKEKLSATSFDLRGGEILGVAGIDGSGQDELVELLLGLKFLQKGEAGISLQGVECSKFSIKDRRENGLGFIPQDRMLHGIAPNMSVKENLIATEYDSEKFLKSGFYNQNAIEKFTTQSIKDYEIKAESGDQEAGMLSGGNMQKVVVAKEIACNPGVLIANQPTRGVDVGAIKLIHEKLIEIRQEGAGVLLISADLNEILELSDSIIVFASGEVTAYFEDASKISEEELGLYMLGVRKQSEEEIRRACHEDK